jgi:DNA-binding XRE family transcriptional regulator
MNKQTFAAQLHARFTLCSATLPLAVLHCKSWSTNWSEWLQITSDIHLVFCHESLILLQVLKMNQAAKKSKAANPETELLSELGDVVRKRRLALDLSQEELASRAGVHRTYLSDIERGARNITITVLARLADALEVKVSRLFRLTEQQGYEQTGKARR